MIHHSKVTKKGNSAYSYNSQNEADQLAADLDLGNNSNCTRLSNCTGLSDCTRLSYCTGLKSTKDIIAAGQPDGWSCYGWLKDKTLIIHCGCRRKSLSEAREYWANKNNRQEVLAAVEYIATVAALKGWET